MFRGAEIMRIFNWLAILTIRVYQVALSPLLRRQGLCCRHHPTCSHYGIIAYAKYGFLKATVMTWKRFCDCHPGSNRPFIDVP
jgi:putative membrane protein insertion efficiency factor